MTDYVKDSRLEVLVLRPKKTTVAFEIHSSDAWDVLWELDHNRGVWGAPKLKQEDCVATTFKMTLISLPRGMQASDLTLSKAVRLVYGEISSVAKEDRAGRHRLPQRAGQRGVGFGRPKVD